MKFWRSLGVVVILLSFLTSGCTRFQKVKAVEEETDLPYDSLGQLEVQTKAYSITPTGALWDGIELLTLTFAPTPSRGERYKRILSTKLSRHAREHYGAHQVINVTYWPDPESRRFPEGIIRARGEMVRFRPFSPVEESAGPEIFPETPAAVPATAAG